MFQVEFLKTEEALNIEEIKSLLAEQGNINYAPKNAEIAVVNLDGKLVACLVTTPVQLQNRKGKHLQSFTILPEYNTKEGKKAVLQTVEAKVVEDNDFFIVQCQNKENDEFFKENGFSIQTGLRRIQKEIKPNLVAYAEQDTVTASAFQELRESYIKNLIHPYKENYPSFFTELYENNATILKADDGYGVYYKDSEKLIFTELFAKTQKGAMKILQAARNITGCFEAEFYIEARSELFLGEGVIVPYALIKPLNNYFSQSEEYYFNTLLNK